MKQIFNTVIQELMTQLDTKTNQDAGCQMRNPHSVYLDSQRAEVEWKHLFQSYTHVVGLSADLPNKGSFFTCDDLGKPMLFTRDNNGKFHAFLNTCRHRGAVVETRQRGEAKLFSCPFHAWGYNPTGELIAVPHEDHFGKVDKACNSLIELPAEEKLGLLFICPDPKGQINVDEALQGMGDELAYFDLENVNVHAYDCYQHAMNWKLANDTFGETYHFNTLHRDTLAQSFYGNVQVSRFFGRNHALSLCMKSIDFLRDLPQDQWDIRDATTQVYYLFPNIQLIISGLGPILVKIYPDGTDLLPKNWSSIIY